MGRARGERRLRRARHGGLGRAAARHRALRSRLSGRKTRGAARRVRLSQVPATLRDWGLYEDDGSRQFVFRSTTREWDDFSPRPSDVRGRFRRLISRRCRGNATSASSPLCARRAHVISIDLDDRKLRSVPTKDVAELVRSVDLFMPSRQDGRAIFPDASPADTVRRFRDMAPETALIVLKCGADGSIAHAAGSRDLIALPAFPVAAVDATGAGDSFCGGALVGYVRTANPVQALLHGAVSASFCVETVGCAGLLNSTPKPRQNASPNSRTPSTSSRRDKPKANGANACAERKIGDAERGRVAAELRARQHRPHVGGDARGSLRLAIPGRCGTAS